ncbi:MAG: hypothetical protein ACRDNY_05385 [Gaiellaceae bacterium]
MRRRLTWLLVTLGIAALVRRLRRRGERAERAPSPGPGEGDPADELRRKIAESRSDEGPAEPAPPEATVDERRAEVHGEGRSALEEMRTSDEG